MNAKEMRDSQSARNRRPCPWRSVYWFDNFLRPLFHNTRKLFSPYVRPGMTVLDVGCGRGFASLGLARLVGDSGMVIAADLQPEMLEMVKDRAARAGVSGRIRTHLCEADRIGVREELDFAVALWMVHETLDAPVFLREAFTLLKPGARFLIAEPKGHISPGDFERTVQQAREAGFTIPERPRVRLSRAALLVKQ